MTKAREENIVVTSENSEVLHESNAEMQSRVTDDN